MNRREPARMVALCDNGSRTRTAVPATLDDAGEMGAETELLGPRSFGHPGVKSSTGSPTDANRVRQQVDEAGAILAGPSSYHSAYSGMASRTTGQGDMYD